MTTSTGSLARQSSPICFSATTDFASQHQAYCALRYTLFFRFYLAFFLHGSMRTRRQILANQALLYTICTQMVTDNHIRSQIHAVAGLAPNACGVMPRDIEPAPASSLKPLFYGKIQDITRHGSGDRIAVAPDHKRTNALFSRSAKSPERMHFASSSRQLVYITGRFVEMPLFPECNHLCFQP
jgi:hypothetical protein